MVNMILEIVKDREEIKKLHNRLAKQLRAYDDLHGNNKLEIKTRGGQWIVNFCYNKETDMWWSNDDGSKPFKFYNRFGFSPREDTPNRMTVQINYLKDFVRLQEAALWAKDKKGRYYLLHSGRLGGGVEGITMENIAYLINWDTAICEYKKKDVEFYIVCEITDNKAFYQLAAFVKEIARIKNILFANTPTKKKSVIKSHEKSSRTKLKEYKPEFWGKREYNYEARGVANCNHGLVVQKLKEHLENNLKRLEIVKNQFVDLGISRKDKALAIFEIKTTCNKQHIYTAIGQLMMHSHSTKVKPIKYFVAPDKLDKRIVVDLEAMGIKTIIYSWKESKPVFKNLELVFSDFE